MESTRIPWNQMNELKPHKGEHTWVIYTIGGEHLIIDGDYLTQYDDHIKIYQFEEDEHGEEKWIAAFYRSNLVGLEQIK